MKRRFSLIFAVLILAAAACGRAMDDTSIVVPMPPARGLPQDVGSRTSEPAPSPSAAPRVTFADVSAKVFQPRCMKCHSSENWAGDIELEHYAEVMKNVEHPKLIVAGNPDASELYQQVRDHKMPKRRPPLTADELQLVFDWISQGAIE